MKVKINSIVSDLAIFIENVLFPIIFFYFAYENLLFVYTNYTLAFGIFTRIIWQDFDTQDLIFISDFLASAGLIFFDLLVAFGLLIRKNLYQKPEGIVEIFLPVIDTFFYLFYNLLPYLPGKWNFLLIPKNFFLSFCIFGSFMVISGVAISTVATYNLRYSYGIFVQVRRIVTDGLYRSVRHPIYLGYLIYAFGLGILNPRLYYAVLVLISFSVTISRAHAEEKKLVKFCPEYSQYSKKTPFLFPKI